jgi:hypothetical protein
MKEAAGSMREVQQPRVNQRMDAHVDAALHGKPANA